MQTLNPADYPFLLNFCQWGPVPYHPDLPIYQASDTFQGGTCRILFMRLHSTLDEYLVARISEAAARERDISGIFEVVHQSLHRHGQVYITTGGSNFQQLL
ncbi:hypothetical protein TNCV_4950781 [Trichonephila clavipes]|nr:hypothetical protein TNCV_4950781 [Trichonephila clavipes]